MTTRRRRARRKAGVGAVTDDGATGEGAGDWPATGRTGMPYQCPWADATQVARTRAGTHAVKPPRRERTGLRRTGVRGSPGSGIRSAGVLLYGPGVGARRAWGAQPPMLALTLRTHPPPTPTRN